MSEDPSGFDAGDANLYRYVANDPLGKHRSPGLQPFNPTQLLGSLGAMGAGTPYLVPGLNAGLGGRASSTPLSMASHAAARDPILAEANAYFRQNGFESHLSDPFYSLQFYARPGAAQLAPISPSGISTEYIESGAARRAVEEGNRHYAEAAVQQGTWGQGDSAEWTVSAFDTC